MDQIKKQRGGRRPGAGAKKKDYRTTIIRVPVFLIPQIKALINEKLNELKAQSAEQNTATINSSAANTVMVT